MNVPIAALPPELVARFAQDLARVWPAPARGPSPARRPNEGEPPRLALAVSGGPDSLALLLLAHAALPGRIAAATVDHRLRPASAAEADEVARICAGLGVPHAILGVALAPGNVQAEARTARYAALGRWMGEQGLTALATAHHADDQAETLLMRLNRGSGVAGLAGVRTRGPLPGDPGGPGWVARPLLGWRRAELAAIVEAAGLVAADDPSNRDPAYDRVRLRAGLATAAWLDVAGIAASAGHLADADAALEWAAAREWAECVNREGLGYTYRPQAPRAVALRVLALIIDRLDGGEAPEPAAGTAVGDKAVGGAAVRPKPVRGNALARLFEALVAGQPASIGDLVARAGPGGWSFTRAPRRRS